MAYHLIILELRRSELILFQINDKICIRKKRIAFLDYSVLEYEGTRFPRNVRKHRVTQRHSTQNLKLIMHTLDGRWRSNYVAVSKDLGHILRRNCLLQQVIEGKIKGQIEVTRRRGRRRKKLLDDLKDRGAYCQLKEEALARTMWRNILEETLDLSFDRLLMMMMMMIHTHKYT